MTAIVLQGFAGEQPRTISRLLPPNAAQAAVNTRLDDGGLSSWRSPARVSIDADDDWVQFMRHDDDWIGFDTPVSAAQGPVDTSRLYYTGDGVPKMLAASTLYDLAVPAPGTAPALANDGAGTGDVTTRVYCFTWVTSFGEESEPSPVTVETDWQPGDTVTLSSFPAHPTDRAITKRRIYRSQTGTVGTFFYLIDEHDVTDTTYDDDVAPDAFQETLPSSNWNAPHDELAGLVALPNGIMAAFVGKRLYFSEPFRPHAWPEKYALTTETPIVALGAIGSILVVLTETTPYLARGATPDAMQMDRIEQILPCINAGAVVNLGYAVAYPSQDGLAAIAADGSARLVTGNIFKPEDWQRLSPSTMMGAQLAGRYVAVYDSADIALEFNTGALFINLGAADYLIRADIPYTAIHFDPEAQKLYYLDGAGGIWEFDSYGAPPLEYYWKSREFVLSRPESMAALMFDSPEELTVYDAAANAATLAQYAIGNAAKIADGTTLSELNATELNGIEVNGDSLQRLDIGDVLFARVDVYADGDLVHSITEPNKVKRLPGGFKSRRWEIAVNGNALVERVVCAGNVEEIKVAP